ncbi:DoxX-like family protein [Mucilaginibacter sp. OK268]|uniref:DoxX family protein n=1 Tax=Mucilaginibacter sp. OK268 TaxID=1881048 RepID=UPI000891568D|nr:DoxX family protein [Mucilaginibacter sp. OK268]SDQ01776.1 DoxX-like family protein [Mucilaginibacter sp. OK268]
METTQSQPATTKNSKASFITGTVISVLCILFLLFDAIGKIVLEKHAVSASAKLGWVETTLPGMGITLLISTILYTIPKTKILGAILLTAYLGGATATMVRVGLPFYFSVVFGILVWAGAYLTNSKLRDLLPLVK